MTAGKGDGQVFWRNLSDLVRIGLIKAGISVHFVKIIDTQMIFRRFVFNNIMSAKDLSDFLFYGNSFQFLNHEHIDLWRLLTQEVFFAHIKILHLIAQGDTKRC